MKGTIFGVSASMMILLTSLVGGTTYQTCAKAESQVIQASAVETLTQSETRTIQQKLKINPQTIN